MRHFEDLWDEAEKVKGQPDREKTLAQIIDLVAQYDRLHIVGDQGQAGFTASGKQKAMGDILLLLANLSAMDTIDVYKALHEAIQRSGIRALDISHEKSGT